MTRLTRKQFLASLAAAAALPLVLPGCASGDDDGGDTGDGAGGDCLADGTQATISSNHGHLIAVSAADVEAGVEKTYDISGSSGHMHEVTLTAAHFAELQANTSITVQSTSSGDHTHAVTISCA
jgi:hypothetical protein